MIRAPYNRGATSDMTEMAEELNRFARVVNARDSGMVEIFAPVRETGLIRTLVTAETASAVNALLAGDGNDTFLPSLDIEMLRAAGVIIPAGKQPRPVRFNLPDEAIPEEVSADICPGHSNYLERKGHACIPGLLPLSHVVALNHYVTELVVEGWLKRGDGFCDRYVAHNSSIARFYQDLMLPSIARLAGQELRSTFNYVASYSPGADLPLHTDRPQCDYTISMFLGQSLKSSSKWTLEVENLDAASTFETYVCEPGEAIIFRGPLVRHGRPPWRGPGLYNLVLWHYVDATFSGELD
jgi:hypothetical protein